MGGDSTSVEAELIADVKKIFSTEEAFVALKTDGSVVAWGDSKTGGDISTVKNLLGKDVSTIYSNKYAMAAVLCCGQETTQFVGAAVGSSSAFLAYVFLLLGTPFFLSI